MSLKNWVTGARVRTLPLAISPILLGSAAASLVDKFDLSLSVLAAVVSLSLQVGVNYANDYSDGVRGTDKDRVGPVRLTGSGLVEPKKVKLAAFAAFAVAALAGSIVILITSQFWIALVGLVSIIAAWYYTGGKRPYGYAGLGEIVVFVFFGLVATIGTSYIQTLHFDGMSLLLGINFGLYATAVLLVNNIRDIETDKAANKNTLAVKLGAKNAKFLFGVMVWLPVIFNLLLILIYPATILGLVNLVLVIPAFLSCVKGRSPKELITSLKLTSLAGFGFGLLISIGLVLVSF